MLAFAPSINAQVYRCEVNGSIVYQQAPCDAGRGREVDARPNLMDPVVPQRRSGARIIPGRPSSDTGNPNRTLSSECRFPWEGRLPGKFVVYVAGGSTGEPIAEAVDPRGGRAGRFDIDLNRSDLPVALVLVSTSPTVWNIRKTAETRVVGVWATGSFMPLVAGLGSDVLVHKSSTADNTPCATAEPRHGAANLLARRAFAQSAESFYDLSDQKRILIGAPLRDKQSFASAGPPYTVMVENTMALPGKVGLERTEQAGLIRRMTPDDVKEWVTFYRACIGPMDVPPIANPKPEKFIPPHNGYVVLKPFRFPPGLYGANAAEFYVFKGTPAPVGERGHSTVHDANAIKCTK